MKTLKLIKQKQLPSTLLALCGVVVLSACGSSGGAPGNTSSFNVSGSVLGLKGTLVVENNSADPTSLTLDGDVALAADIPEGTNYNIAVVTQPAKQYCEVVNGTGTVTQDISHIKIFCNDEYFFSAHGDTDQLTNGVELWKTNGTTQGTLQVSDINPSGDSMWRLDEVRMFNGNAYFSADNGVHGRELWRSDGTASGTIRLTDLSTSGQGNSNPSGFIELDNKLLFNAFNETFGYTISHAMDTGETVSVLSAFTLQPNHDFFGNTLFLENFSMNQSDMVIMSSDGVTISEHLFNSGYVHDPTRLKVVGDKIFYLSVVDVNNTELYVVDADGLSSPQLVRSFESVDIFNVTNDQRKQTISFNGKFFFNASDGINGHTLWSSDGTTQGTQMLLNPDNSSADSEVSALTVMDDKLFFAVNGVGVSGLWVTDGTAQGTIKLSGNAVLIDNMAGVSYPASANGLMFFRTYNTDNGTELWASDGTTAGTRMVKDINPGTDSSNPVQLVSRNGYILFTAYDSLQTGQELWRSDGTEEGTYMVKDICELDNCGGLAGFPQA